MREVNEFKMGKLRKIGPASLKLDQLAYTAVDRKENVIRPLGSLNLTEDDYKTIFENSAVAITVTDKNERLLLCNQVAEHLLGMGPDEYYLKDIKQIYPQEEWTRIRSENIRQKGINHHMETKIINSKGKVIDVDLSVSVLKGTDGGINGSIGIMRDISERKMAELSLKESMELSRGMIETAPTAIFLLKDGHFTFANRILEAMTGYTAAELMNISRQDLIFPEYADKCLTNIQDLIAKKPVEPLVFRVLRKDMETIWVSEKITTIEHSGKNQIMGNWMDITDWKIAEAIAADHSNQTEILLEIGNTVGRTLNLHEIAENVLNILSRKLHNGPIAFFSIPIQTEQFTLLAHSGFSDDFVKRMTKVVLGKGLIGRIASSGKTLILYPGCEDPRFDIKILQKDGLWSICVIPVFARDKINGVICMGSHNQHHSLGKQAQLLELVANQIGVAIDNARVYEKTSEMAFTDGLTGLYNRRFFEEELKRELSRSSRNGQPFSVISLDLDNLKVANDTFGHLVGDQLLKKFSSVLLKFVRKSDIAARVGGDEFMILVTDANLDCTNTMAQRMLQIINATYLEVESSRIDLSASGGIASFPVHGETIESILTKADEAMYQAKKNGKNRILTA